MGNSKSKSKRNKILAAMAAVILILGFQNCSDVNIAPPEKPLVQPVPIPTPEPEPTPEPTPDGGGGGGGGGGGSARRPAILLFDFVSKSSTETINNPANLRITNKEDSIAWCVKEHALGEEPVVPEAEDSCFSDVQPTILLLTGEGQREATVFFKYPDGEILPAKDQITYSSVGQAIYYSPMAGKAWSAYGFCKINSGRTFDCMTFGFNNLSQSRQYGISSVPNLRYASDEYYITQDDRVFRKNPFLRSISDPMFGIGEELNYNVEVMGRPMVAKGQCVLSEYRQLWCFDNYQPYGSASSMQLVKLDFPTPIDDFVTSLSDVSDTRRPYRYGFCVYSLGKIHCKGEFPVYLYTVNLRGAFDIPDWQHFSELDATVYDMQGHNSVVFHANSQVWVLGSLFNSTAETAGLRVAPLQTIPSQNHIPLTQVRVITHTVWGFDTGLLGDRLFSAQSSVEEQQVRVFDKYKKCTSTCEFTPFVYRGETSPIDFFTGAENLGLLWNSAWMIATKQSDGKIKYLNTKGYRLVHSPN